MNSASGDRGRHRSVSSFGIASSAPASPAAPETARGRAPAPANPPITAPSPVAPEETKATQPAARFFVVWQFEVAEHNITAFEAAYGSDGDWARLFRASPDYLGTELLRDAYVAGLYLTIDRWASEGAFRAFRRAHDADYEELDRQCDSLTAKETRIGAFIL